MYDAEVHRTVKLIEIVEQLDFDLTITEDAYRSDHDISGEVRVEATPNRDVVRNRETPLTNVVDLLTTTLVGKSAHVNNGVPGERLHIGFTHRPPYKIDDEEYRERFPSEATDVDGLPDNGTITVEVDWDAEDAKEYLSENSRKVVSEEYEITEFPSNLLPVVVRGELYRDAYEVMRKEMLSETEWDSEPSQVADRREKQLEQYKGQAALTIELELQQNLKNVVGDTPPALSVNEFRVSMDTVLPNASFVPDSATYDPESKQVTWTRRQLSLGETLHYRIIGPLEELLSIGTIEADVRGRLKRFTMSGARIDKLFDQSGDRFPASTRPEIRQNVLFTAAVDIDPSALQTDSQKVTRSTLRVQSAPEALYQRVTDLCRREGIDLLEQDPPGEAEPIVGRDGVFEVTKENDTHGHIRTRREFGDRGIVYGELTIEGQYTAVTERSEVSAFDESEDRIVRADEGGMRTSGQSSVEVVAQSTMSELNSEFIELIENGLSGGEY